MSDEREVVRIKIPKEIHYFIQRLAKLERITVQDWYSNWFCQETGLMIDYLTHLPDLPASVRSQIVRR